MARRLALATGLRLLNFRCSDYSAAWLRPQRSVNDKLPGSNAGQFDNENFQFRQTIDTRTSKHSSTNSASAKSCSVRGDCFQRRSPSPIAIVMDLAAVAQMRPWCVHSHSTSITENGPRIISWFADWAAREATAVVGSRNMRLRTTLIPGLQKLAEQAIDDMLSGEGAEAPIGLMVAARADSVQDSAFPAEMASGSAQCCEKVIARNARRCSQISPRLSRRPTCRCFSMVGGNR